MTVMFLAALVVPTLCPPKLKLPGVRVSGARPEPLSATVCGLLLALSVMLRVPGWLPLETGAKLTVMVH